MKKLVKTPVTVEKIVEKVVEEKTTLVDVPDGLETAFDKVVVLHCMNYIYSGRLVGVNEKFVKLDEASVVFETGPYAAKEFKTAEAVPTSLYVQMGAIEAWWVKP